jgi:dolichol-phosphate mannosyltransferase
MKPDSVIDKLGLVIPTLNESENIVPLFRRVRDALDSTAIDYELIVVDDGSRDGTQELVRRNAASESRIRLIERKGKKGLAGAVICGWQHTTAGLLAVMDADLQHPPELLPDLLKAIRGGHDIAVASRYANGNEVSGWNPLRLAISRLLTWVTRPFQRRHIRISDPMSGYFIVRRHCVEGLNLQPQGFKILFEILVRGRIRSAVEVPFQFGSRHGGKSKADLKVALHYFALLGRLSRDLLLRPDMR